MALEMRDPCERLRGAALAMDGEAVICSHECTVCPSCGADIAGVCPSCGGELVPRPKGVVAP